MHSFLPARRNSAAPYILVVVQHNEFESYDSVLCIEIAQLKF
jgi:hypothetical protein